MKEKIQLTNGGRGGNDPSVNGNEAPLPPTYHNLREKAQVIEKIMCYDGVMLRDYCIAIEIMIDFHQPNPSCIGKYHCWTALNCDGPEDCAAYLPEGVEI